MARKPSLEPQRLREEIAIAAARMIAQDGLDYANAKRKAARQVVGDARIAGDWLPDNDQIENEIREYQALFQSDSQPTVLRELRRIALDWMERLAAFNPYLTGAVLNGTASEHSDVHLQVFCDNPKDVAIFLLNAGVNYDVSESRHFAGRGPVETLSFVTRLPHTGHTGQLVGVIIAVYGANDLRGALRADSRGRTARAAAQSVAALLEADLAAQPAAAITADKPAH